MIILYLISHNSLHTLCYEHATIELECDCGFDSNELVVLTGTGLWDDITTIIHDHISGMVDVAMIDVHTKDKDNPLVAAYHITISADEDTRGQIMGYFNKINIK